MRVKLYEIFYNNLIRLMAVSCVKFEPLLVFLQASEFFYENIRLLFKQ